jgi:hypothetical protein
LLTHRYIDVPDDPEDPACKCRAQREEDAEPFLLLDE